jgi:hypothetical protein
VIAKKENGTQHRILISLYVLMQVCMHNMVYCKDVGLVTAGNGVYKESGSNRTEQKNELEYNRTE